MINLYSLTPKEFEDLCFEYACEIYDNEKYVLFHTQYSHDGGKDMEINFYDELHRFKIWAECKQHTNNIGLEEIGKNIVLVIANHVNKILFFSASDIRQSAKTEILKIAKRLNFIVEFLDGKTLIQELEKFPEILKNYFENYENTGDINLCQDLVFKIYISENAQDDFFNEGKTTVYLKGGKLFFINLLIENHTSDYFTEFSIDIGEMPKNIELLEVNDSENLPNEINPHSDISISYLCSIKNLLWEKIQLPELEVNYLTSAGKYISTSIKLPIIDLSKYVVYQFSGKFYIEFIANEVTQGIILSKAQIPQFYDIRGASGTGKSRLIEEMRLCFLEKGFHAFQYDCNDYSELDLIKKIICDISNLSAIYKDPTFKQENFINCLTSYKLSMECKRCLAEFVINRSNTDFSYSRIIFSLMQLVKGHIPNKPIFISIDNIQEGTPSLINFLQQLVMDIKNERLHLALAFVLNTEYIPKESYENCQKYMRFFDNLLSEKNQIHKCECKGFSQEDQLLFWMEAFNRHVPDDQLILKLTNHFGDTPLELVTACDYLKKNKILVEDISGEWYIKKQDLLENLFQSALKDFESIFDKRYHAFLNFQTNEERKKIFDIISSIVCFRNNLPPDFALQGKLDLELIDLLIRNKILRVKPSENTFSFYHDSIYRYFTADISRNLSSINYIIIDYLTKGEFDNKEYLLFFIYYRYGNLKKVKELGLNLLKEKVKNYLYHEAIEVGKLIYENSKIKNDSFDYYLECATIYAFALSSNGNKTLSCRLFMELCPLILERQKELPLERVGEFFRDAVNAQLQCFYFEQAKTVIDYYKQVENLSIKYQFLIQNREGVVWLSLNNLEKAMDCFNMSLITTKKMDNHFFWSSTTHSDIALLYFYGDPVEDNLNSCIAELEKAIEEYNMCEDNTRFRKSEILWHQAFIAILKKEFVKGERPLKEAMQIKAQSQEVYTVYRLNNLLALIYLYTARITEAEKLLLSLKSICEVHHYYSGVLRICNNLGIVYHLKNDHAKADEYFSLALTLLEPNMLSLKLYPIVSNNYLSSLQFNNERLNFVKNCVKQTTDKRLIQYCKRLNVSASGFTLWTFDGFDYIF